MKNIVLLLLCWSGIVAPVLALPPVEDVPEEVLRTEVITEARSPVDGTPVSAAQYAELQQQLATRKFPPQLSSEIRQRIFLLRVRRLIRTVVPFAPI